MRHGFSLFVDTISLTIPIEPNRRETIDSRISDSFELFFGSLIDIDATKTRYRYWVRLERDGHRIADVWFSPRSSNNNYLRIEYSPANAFRDGLTLLGQWLAHVLGDNWRNEFMEGYLTRIDLAFDLIRVPISKIIIFNLAHKKSKLYRGPLGETQSYYYPPHANKQVVIYDKLEERLERTGTLKRPNRLYGEVTRIELRQRNLVGYTLRNFVSKQINRNPFKKLVIKKYMLDTTSGLTEDQQRSYFNQIRFMGLSGVLASICDPEIKLKVTAFYHSLPRPQALKFDSLLWNRLRHALDTALPISPIP